ncbi:hypothetical protein D3C87_1838870 [compost metagenome]
MQVPLGPVELHDEVPDQLPRGVVGGLAPALDLEGRHALPRLAHVLGGVGLAAQGDDRLVLEQQQAILDAVVRPQVHQLLLELPGLGVGEAPQVIDAQRLAHGFPCS